MKGKKRKEVTYNLMKAVLPASKTSASKLALLSETAWPAATATSVERTIVLSIFFCVFFVLFCGEMCVATENICELSKCFLLVKSAEFYFNLRLQWRKSGGNIKIIL